ncbi:hypothetical protein TorRG33x02_303560 [Trema orientale]|uniref:Uncharacterized protein n=1 Tax=Trema orientale TaxID=63057 RepID=A0A2P5BZD2_TREOI|nr:hypothetical protein TorRG33x02_303560 [Trema orientale]
MQPIGPWGRKTLEKSKSADFRIEERCVFDFTKHLSSYVHRPHHKSPQPSRRGESNTLPLTFKEFKKFKKKNKIKD